MVQTKNTGIALYCLSLQSSDINLLSCIKVMLVIYPPLHLLSCGTLPHLHAFTSI